MFSDRLLEEVRERTDLLSLVGEYVSLKKAGTSHKGLCPFHSEKSPSFHVHPARGFFYCFGCQASGDAIGFLMRLEGISFPDTVRRLAEKLGLEVEDAKPQERRADAQRRERRQNLLSMMDAAAGFFIEQMKSHPQRAHAANELASRKIGQDAADNFRLGYAPPEWSGLAEYLRKAGYNLRDAEEIGLVIPRRNGGYYDRFRHRLMFPVSDAHGKVVAFSGRALTPLEAQKQPPPKYINSPESSIYKKGELLFGLHEARVALRQSGEAVVCEGNFDLVALHQAGVSNAVASLGTAFTPKQVKLLRRYAQKIVFLYDSDNAGKKAVAGSFPLLQAEAVDGQVVLLPQGDDPDSFLRREGAEALMRLIKGARGIVEFLIDEAAANAPSTAQGVSQAVMSLKPVFAAVKEPIAQRLYLERAARRFGLRDLDAIAKQLGVGGSRNVSRSAQNQERRRGGNHQNDPFSSGFNGPEPLFDRPPGQEAGFANKNQNSQQLSRSSTMSDMEREVLGLILDMPELIFSASDGIFKDEFVKRITKVLTDRDLQAIFQAVVQQLEQKGRLEASELSMLSEGEAQAWLAGRLAMPLLDVEDSGSTSREKSHDKLGAWLERLEQRKVEKIELPRLREQIVSARRQGDDRLAEELTRTYYERLQAAQRQKVGRR